MVDGAEGEAEEVLQLQWEDAVQMQFEFFQTALQMIEKNRTEVVGQLEHVADLRMRDMLLKQVLLWDVQAATISGLKLALFGLLGLKVLVVEIHAAMGCSVRRDN